MRISTDISVNEWSSFVRAHPEGTVFQLPEMFELFYRTDKFEPLVLGAYNEDEKICGLLLGVYIHERKGMGKLLSSRFVVYGGPLLIGDTTKQEQCLDVILKELVLKTRNRALFIQFRNFFSQGAYLPVFEKHGFSYLDRLNYVIVVQGMEEKGQNVIEEVKRKMNDGRRRQLEKALRSGAEIIEPDNISQVKDFYNILFRLYRYRVRKPLPNWSFFENFYRQSYPSPQSPNPHTGLGIIRLIRYQNQIIGGILSPIFDNRCIYEWYVCGLDREYKDQHPSILATWAVLEYAAENNIEYFDFMGVGRPDREYGVRDFKARFGGDLVNYGRLTRINNNFLYQIAELGFNILALFKRI